MTRNIIIAGNWKMNLGLEEASNLARSIDSSEYPGIEVVVFPSFPWMIPVTEVLKDTKISTGAQNCYLTVAGAFTGEVSPAMIAEIGSAVLAGHSERRHVLGESNEFVGQKVEAASACSLQVFLCVGELLEQRESGATEAVVTDQLQTGLANISQTSMSRIVIAYEPVWAIGTGKPATAADAQTMCAFIRRWVATNYSIAIAENIQVLYGGSVNAENAQKLFSQPDIDGALIGGASLDPVEFNDIISVAATINSV